jgi:hypothetical protein
MSARNMSTVACKVIKAVFIYEDCEILGSHSGVDEDSVLLGSYAVATSVLTVI